ncbi:hypothetical protein J4558_27725 [Leptolyngbya sp. 15MV]|nr:hypothetical protein J4558_27725 [Leptolyngbya sp. 15MV]
MPEHVAIAEPPHGAEEVDTHQADAPDDQAEQRRDHQLSPEDAEPVPDFDLTQAQSPDHERS